MRPGLLGLAAAAQNMAVPAQAGSRAGLIHAGRAVGAGLTGSYTATRRCAVEIAIVGAGASGNDLNKATGNGAGASYKSIILHPGQSFSWVTGVGGAQPSNGNGAAGTDTVVTLPTGLTFRAEGGRQRSVSAVASTGVGGDINRAGGLGATGATAGNAGENGGDGGISDGATNAGGGGPGGFNDFAPLFAVGDCVTSQLTTGIDPGAGGCGTTGGGGTANRGGHGGIYYLVSAVRGS